MKKVFYSLLVVLGLWACGGQATSDKGVSDSATTTKAPPQTATTKVVNEVAASAKKRSTTSASTLQNLSTGYWHLGGSINTGRPKKEEGYKGEWIKFNNDQTYVLGQNEKDKSSGAWIFQEEGEFIRFESQDSSFLTTEYHVKQLGDIILLLGNTPTNNNGAQIKLVREGTKVIEHNPN